ncbi:MAG: S4 domain-containing protein [Pseudomonadota bacterium]|nr:S4 domain-containing protein [Pseudomonadota bacterium]
MTNLKNFKVKKFDVEHQRTDNWLYRIRLAKTRNIAQKLIKEGKVRINKVKIQKPSNKLKYGDIITLRKNDQIMVIEVIGFTKRRLDYKKAKTHYQIL